MDRRKILLGSAGAVTTLVAGCTSSSGSETSAGNGTDDDHSGDGEPGADGDGYGEDRESGDEEAENQNAQDDEHEPGDGEGTPAEIAGFVPDDCELDSDLIRIKEFERHGRTLTVCIVAMTDDLRELRGRVEEFAPALERGIEDADGFFAEIEELEFTLENEAGETLASVYLDADRLRECIDGDLTNEELANMARYELEQE